MTVGLEAAARRVLRAERVRRRMTQATVAALVGRSRKWISDFENGKIDPGASSLFALASALEVTVSFVAAEEVGDREGSAFRAQGSDASDHAT